MTFEYDRDTGVTKTAENEFTAELSTRWGMAAALNGGYLLGVIGRALGQTVPGRPDPISVSAYYLNATGPGPATVTTAIKRSGGSIATLAADLVQDGTTRITALATYGDLSQLPEGHRTTATPPELPPREECIRVWDRPEHRRDDDSMHRRFEMLFHPEQAGWASGEPSGNGEISAWFRFADGREPDPLSLLTVVDLLPPVTVDLGKFGWAPTLELTVHVRAIPAPGWLRVRHATRNIAGGMFEEDCEIWDSADRLVTQSRQLARLPR